MKTKTFFPLLTAIFLCFALANADVKYPNPVGHVNDFAKILPADTAKKLETELRTYKDQTGIEISVVTVGSLEGLSVEDYTISLARKWGVGAKKKDNGVVLLVAPNERKVRIEVGYGLEPDLTDSQAGRVIRDQIIPLFKEGKMTDGVVAGVAGILSQLGDTPYKARAEERATAAEKKRREAERQKEALVNFLLVAAPVLTIAVIIGFIIFAIKRHVAWKRKLIAWHSQNYKRLAENSSKIGEAESEYGRSLALVDLLKKENPREVWEELEKKVGAIPANVKALKERQIGALRVYDKGWKHAEEASGTISKLHSDAVAYSSVYEEVLAKKDELFRARERSDGLRVELSERFIKARSLLDHPDVKQPALEKLKDAERKFSAAEAMLKLSAPMLNWLSVYAFLSNAADLVKAALRIAESDKADARKARTEGPKLLESVPVSIKKAEEAVSDSDVSSSTKHKVEEAKAKYKEAKKLASVGAVDWLSVWVLLSAAVALLSEAVRGAESDIDDAERSRRRRRDDDSYHSSSPSSSWSFGGSSSSDSGGGFGGFGGGGFGGGGASGSW